MKNLCYILILILLITACGSKDLDKANALKLLQEQKDYPKTIETDIYIVDPVDATKLLKSGLEKEGFVKIIQNQKLADVGKPLITFTEKARPYLIPQTDKDSKNNIQRVRVAEEFIEDIISIKMEEDKKTALVSYKTSKVNKTPFFIISGINGSGKGIKKLKFIINENEWLVRF